MRYSFDGFGLNDRANRRGRRIASLTDANRDREHGLFLERAANNHDALLAALRAVMWHLDARLIDLPDDHAEEAMDDARAAIAAATGGEG
jgi:hypothetical protein